MQKQFPLSCIVLFKFVKIGANSCQAIPFPLCCTPPQSLCFRPEPGTGALMMLLGTGLLASPLPKNPALTSPVEKRTSPHSTSSIFINFLFTVAPLKSGVPAFSSACSRAAFFVAASISLLTSTIPVKRKTTRNLCIRGRTGASSTVREMLFLVLKPSSDLPRRFA